MDIFEGLENLNVSEECFDDIMALIEELLKEGREPFETQQDYKERLQKHFGPKLNDAKSTQKSIAKHHNKVAKGLKKEEKALRNERDAAWDKDKEAHKQWKDSLEVADAVKDKHGADSELYKKVNDKEGKAFDKWMKTTKKVEAVRGKLEATKDKRYNELDKRNDAIHKVTDIVSRKMKTGTYDQTQEK